jgi:hypothetical protein
VVVYWGGVWGNVVALAFVLAMGFCGVKGYEGDTFFTAHQPTKQAMSEHSEHK